MNIAIYPISMISKDSLQMVVIEGFFEETCHATLSVKNGEELFAKARVHFESGKTETDILLPIPDKDFTANAEFLFDDGEVYECSFDWRVPRRWRFKIMVSSHTDIGLHNSVYVQRYNSAQFALDAMRLSDETQDREDKNRYRYTIEGTWFFENLERERGKDAARKLVEEYIKTNKIGICAALAGNHTQLYGYEEVCRSAYEKRRLEEKWGIVSRTMSMIDNNGISMSIIKPYVEAGYENIIFAPNQWNPFPSTLWKMDTSVCNANCPEACGGGSRIDIRYASENPMVFFWKGRGEEKLLVWGSPQYTHGGEPFSIFPNKLYGRYSVANTEKRFREVLSNLEMKYPWDMWLFACYGDDQKPDLDLADFIRTWNEKWEYPSLEMLGNPDVFFDEFKEKYASLVPVLTGEIVGGWYQHTLTVPEITSEKFQADRLLETAEKYSTLASYYCDTPYPKVEIDRAWYALCCNDEHSCGVSGYQGRRVFETWIQHKDWIRCAKKTAENEKKIALEALSEKIKSENGYIIFNPLLQSRREIVEMEHGMALVDIPSLGYAQIEREAFSLERRTIFDGEVPPVLENDFYKISFSESGSLSSVFDKELSRELLFKEDEWGAGEIVVTLDNHKTFSTLKKASFKVEDTPFYTRVLALSYLERLDCECIFEYRLIKHEKRIDIDVKMNSVRGMFNNKRYYKYVYFAFPFNVEGGRRYCNLDGTVAEWGEVTGHTTDTYMAAREWCAVENDALGVALIMKDAGLVEFERIHPDKTSFGEDKGGSRLFIYAANDWLQMHVSRGEDINYRFRYSVFSYSKNYKTAGVESLAERLIYPVDIVEAEKNDGILPSSGSLLSGEGARLITLKRADDGRGMIARFLSGAPSLKDAFGKELCASRCAADESDGGLGGEGFVTLRLEEGLRIKVREISENKPLSYCYTGLVSELSASCGEHDSNVYLLWGKCCDEDFSHYNLYRGLESGFELNKKSLVAKVENDEYCIARYEDTGLSPNTCYYYRVVAVSKSGASGEVSGECSVFTKGSINN